MKALSLSEATMKLSGLIDQVEATDEEVVITRNGRPAAVLVSPDEYRTGRLAGKAIEIVAVPQGTGGAVA